MEGQDLKAMTGMRLMQWLLTAAEMCGVFFIFLTFFERRSEKRWNSVLLGIMIAVLSGLTIWQREDTAMYSRYFMLACILAVTVTALAFFRTGFWKGLLAAALYFETVYFLDVLSGYLGQLATGEEDFVAIIQKLLNPDRLFVMTVSRLLVLGAVLAAVHYKGIVRNIFMRYKLVIAVFVLLEHIGLLYCDQVFYSSVVKKRRIDIYFVFFPLLILFVLILTIVFVLYMEKKNELESFSIRNEMAEKSYQEMIMLYQQRDRIYHDMKNHIAVLSALMEDDDPGPARQYIHKIQKPIRELEQKRYTASRIVNIIMNDKVRRAEAAGISLHVKALEVGRNAVEDMDWCTILANLLDNAIEACEKVSEEERRIDFYLVQKDSIIILKISNPYSRVIQAEGDRLRSRKRNKALHGIGLESVRNSVEKYNGTFEFSYEGEVFRVSVMLFV